jgi:hypothetical protein
LVEQAEDEGVAYAELAQIMDDEFEQPGWQTRRTLKLMRAAGASEDEIRDARRRLANPSF